MAVVGARGAWTALRTLPRPVAVLVIGVGVNRMGTFVPVFLVLYAVSMGLRPAQAGVLLSSYGIGSIVGVLTGGSLTDRFGGVRMIVGSMAAAGVSVGILPITRSFAPLFALCALAGLFTALYRPAAAAVLAALTPSERLVVTTAVYRLGLNIGATLGPLVGGLLATRSFPLVFLADAVTSVLFAVVAATQLPLATPASSTAATRSSYRAVLADRHYSRVLMGMLLIALVEVQYLASLPLEIRQRGMPTSAYVAIVSLNALLVIAFELPFTHVVQRWPMRVSVPIGVGLIGLGIALLGVPGGMVLLIIATLIWTSGEILSAPSAAAYPALVAPESLRGRYLGALAATQAAGYAIGPAVGTAVFEFTRTGVWVACGVVGAVAAGAMWLGVQSKIPQQLPDPT